MNEEEQAMLEARDTLATDCSTCLEECGTPNECPGSRRECGHHCNHIWDQDQCCWCTAHINEKGELVP